MIEAANEINDTPYVWGGGHGSFTSSGYDCSGAVSYALHGGGLLFDPLDSGGFTGWGSPGAGNWITVYANFGHAYMYVAGLRWDTSGGAGPRWHSDARSSSGFTVGILGFEGSSGRIFERLLAAATDVGGRYDPD